MLVTAYLVGLALGIGIGAAAVYAHVIDRVLPGGLPPGGDAAPGPDYDPWEDFDNPLHPYRSRDLDRI